jgi:hypothetical protein
MKTDTAVIMSFHEHEITGPWRINPGENSDPWPYPNSGLNQDGQITIGI